MATVPAHFGFVADQLKLLRAWEPRISDEQLSEGAEALVDTAMALYETIRRAEDVWSEKVSSGEWNWSDGHDGDVVRLYRDWHETAGEVVVHLDALRRRNVAVRHADALREAFANVAALIDIGLERVFQPPTPPQAGASLREVRNGLRRQLRARGAG